MDTKRSTVDDDANISVRLPRKDLRELRVIAARNDRTVSDEVRRLIRQRITKGQPREPVSA